MTNHPDYPTRGFGLEVPTILETQLTGWCGTVRFERRGHQYAIRFEPGTPSCLRDGQAIEWTKLPANARSLAYSAGMALGVALSKDREARGQSWLDELDGLKEAR